MRTDRLSPALSQKLEQATQVVEDALDSYSMGSVWVAWSGGKDSTLVLKLVADVCNRHGVPIPTAIDIDQADAFEEIIEFRSRIADEWKINVQVLRNADLLPRLRRIGDAIAIKDLNTANREALSEIGYTADTFQWLPDSPISTHLLKTIPMQEGLRIHSIQALFTGIRWDEHGARQNETFISPRPNPPHARVNPILHFTERDVWDVTFHLGIPFCSLYHHGYRSLGTRHGTTRPSTVPAWEQDLEGTTERSGRSAEKEAMMDQLRKWGYM